MPERAWWTEQGAGRTLRGAVAVMLLVSVHGCSLITKGDCDTMGQYGVIATVVDARTQAAPVSKVTVTLREGAYLEVVGNSPYTVSAYAGAINREGVYSLTVEAAGYQTFVQNDIRVRGAGSCGRVETNNLTVQLAPAT